MLFIIALILILILCILINIAATIKKKQIQQKELFSLQYRLLEENLSNMNQVLENWNPREVDLHLCAITDISKDIASSLDRNEKRIVEVKERGDERLSEVSFHLQSIDQKG